ncbi:MarR family winged helix-turn-helix transcriptional regulator [Abyssalbus ytuae]|uniref:MarR family transcriptional regulator n=1 Tax=Abyssalbus ytuae TaxID=2926907 RepID=A0A9E6ZU32_9FLAO|nr:MarR family transcriptional regulator [Abyssalbus ytuae]UOB17818.1 MarR family transcriptional regulator [Abyssalbus ytuae]
MKDKTIDYALRATWQAVAKMYNEEAGKFGYTMATAFALLSVDPEDGIPSTSLGPRMGMEATSLSRTLKSMEQKGLIYREPHPEDGRSVIIKLTELGTIKRDLSKEAVVKFNETIKKHTSQEKIENFFEVTEIINELISEKKIFD